MALRFVRQFIKLESSSGIVLFIAAVLAMIIDNTALASCYDNFFQTSIQFAIGSWLLTKPLLSWINDGFMTLFFLLVGLEVKREIVAGELNTIRRAMLPGIAAIGGMIMPALIYLSITWYEPIAVKGWAIPVATDTAFALAILALLGKRIPVGLKIFLTALAIFDDIGAIIVMAIFYSSRISVPHLLIALALIIVLIGLNYYRVVKLFPYLVVGFFLWLSVLNSGVHATLVGIILAMTIPLENLKNPARSPLRWLEHRLHPLVAFYILPLFAFANAGVSFEGLGWHHWLGSIPIGIALGLFFGKQIGIWGSTMLAVKLKIGHLPGDITPFGLYGMSLIAGVGFTMSLFIGTLAFHAIAPFAAYVRMGVIAGSIFSGFIGYSMLCLAYPRVAR
ncbi:MAG: Na+/H+ antiporter NhaA [Coxiellaceae bacterium]|nr:Na+/H+ antiporter NhaA [Coxiellaceae bacterium]